MIFPWYSKIPPLEKRRQIAKRRKSKKFELFQGFRTFGLGKGAGRCAGKMGLGRVTGSQSFASRQSIRRESISLLEAVWAYFVDVPVAIAFGILMGFDRLQR